MKWVFCLLFPAMILPVAAQADLSAELLSGQIEFERLDPLMAENADDPALVFDLLNLKIQALAERGDAAQAAQAAVLRTAVFQRYRDRIEGDLPSLHLDAADLFRLAGDLDKALEQLYAALQAFADQAASPQVQSALLTEIAELETKTGDDAAARQARQAAQSVPAPTDKPSGTRGDDAGFVAVDVYYATDRARTGIKRVSRFYGYRSAERLDYGIAQVTIPKTHVPGSLSAPSIWKLQFAQNPAKHVMLQSIEPVEKERFFTQMRGKLQSDGADDIFVFIHGYNVSFDAAAKRTAQMAYDMSFRGVPVLYSWPSRGATVGYIPDTAVVRLSGRRLTAFLDDLVKQSGASTVHLIAHSMGNRALTDALELMALREAPVETPIFDQVIFAAPDVDRGLFSAMLPTIRPLAKRLTLYVSKQDWALEASRKLHGNLPRAGQGGQAALSHMDVDTVDMSSLGDDMLAHSYVSNDQSAILDILMLFWRNLSPDKRCGMIEHDEAEEAGVWLYEKRSCASLDMLFAVSSLRNAGATSKDQVRATLREEFSDQDALRDLEPLVLEFADD